MGRYTVRLLSLGLDVDGARHCRSVERMLGASRTPSGACGRPHGMELGHVALVPYLFD